MKRYKTKIRYWKVLDMSSDKNVLLNLLDILRKHTDENHRVTQDGLLRILEEKFDTHAVRRTIKNNMENG